MGTALNAEKLMRWGRTIYLSLHTIRMQIFSFDSSSMMWDANVADWNGVIWPNDAADAIMARENPYECQYYNSYLILLSYSK